MHERLQVIERFARLALADRRVLEAIAFVPLAVVVGLSAALTKETTGRHGLTPLVAVETASSSVGASEDESPLAGVTDPLVIDALREAAADASSILGEGPDADLDGVVQASLVPVEESGVLTTRYFNGRAVRPARVLWMTVTAYSPDRRSCGKWADGKTASLHSVWTNAMKLVAADPAVLPLGSMISVPGYDGGRVVPVLDKGGAIKGSRLDVLFPTHETARAWGVKRVPVVVWEYADGLPPDDWRSIRDSKSGPLAAGVGAVE